MKGPIRWVSSSVLLGKAAEEKSARDHGRKSLVTHNVPVMQSPLRTDRYRVAAYLSPERAGVIVFALFKNGAGGDLIADRTNAYDQDGNSLEVLVNVTNPPHAGGEGGGYFCVAFPKGTTYAFMDFNKQGSISDWEESYGYGLYGADQDVPPTVTHSAQATGTSVNVSRVFTLDVDEENITHKFIICGTGWSQVPRSFTATTNDFKAGSASKGSIGLIQSTPGQNRGYLTSFRGYSAEINVSGACRF